MADCAYVATAGVRIRLSIGRIGELRVYRSFVMGSTALLLALPCSLAFGQGDAVPLPLKLPKPAFAGTPKNIPPGSNVEKPTGKPRPIPMVPKGTVNLALHKKVTSSRAPFEGSLDLITDGDKEARDGTAVELKPGLQ